MKWTGRTSSQLQTRTAWEAPNLNQISQKHDLLSQYSNPDYLLGGSTDQGLRNMAWRLQFGDAEGPQTPPPQELQAYPQYPESPIGELEGRISYLLKSFQSLAAELDGSPIHPLKSEDPIAELAGGFS